MKPTDPPVRSVFDCNVFLQAMANPAGPAGLALVKSNPAESAYSSADPFSLSLPKLLPDRSWPANSVYPQLAPMHLWKTFPHTRHWLIQFRRFLCIQKIQKTACMSIWPLPPRACDHFARPPPPIATRCKNSGRR